MSGLTAWERWELASFDHGTAIAANTPPAHADHVTPAERSSAAFDRNEVERICAEAREDGYQAGYQTGLQNGKRAGYEEGQKAARAEADRIGKAANELDQALQEFDQQVADELLALAVEIARQVVRKEIASRPEMILDVVNEALALLPHQHAAIHLNPEDASLVRSYLGDALTHAGHRILEEPTLKHGDCLLEAGGSQIDATTATRWRRVIESLGMNERWETRS
jgi:flagellar assembly protein FliH